MDIGVSVAEHPHTQPSAAKPPLHAPRPTPHAPRPTPHTTYSHTGLPAPHGCCDETAEYYKGCYLNTNEDSIREDGERWRAPLLCF